MFSFRRESGSTTTETVSFLPLKESDDSSDSSQAEEFRSSLRACTLRPPLLLHILLILAYTLVFWILVSAHGLDSGASLIWGESLERVPEACDIRLTFIAPGRDALSWTTKVFDISPEITESSAWLYCGPPDPELDLRWSRLLNCKFRLEGGDIFSGGLT